MPALPDVAVLRDHPDLIEAWGWVFATPGDAPWDDHSYLGREDLANPDITANVQAMTAGNAIHEHRRAGPRRNQRSSLISQARYARHTRFTVEGETPSSSATSSRSSATSMGPGSPR